VGEGGWEDEVKEDEVMTTGLIKNQHVSSKKKSRAIELRRNMTEAEKIFWAAARGRKFRKLKFRRQQIIEGFVIDFYCDELRLCVEIDGAVHRDETAKKYDAERDKALKMHGLTMLRFTNDEAIRDVNKVLQTIGAGEVTAQTH
jgi:very-short-patch-repair endonuclease